MPSSAVFSFSPPEQFRFGALFVQATNNVVILSERSESKDLRTIILLSTHLVRRSFDYGLSPSAQDDRCGGCLGTAR